MKTLSTQHLGPLMIDIEGHTLTALDHERLTHPLVGGMILFTRNYRDRQQLTELCAEIHALRTPRLLIAIDHEGGRVQRCRDDFTLIPAMRKLGVLWDSDATGAREAARTIGYLLAAELRHCGVDFSFTPVLDLDWGRSGIIGDRAFHRVPQAVTELAGALIEGLRLAGMRCCGKHFPGHGWVAADSHVTVPVDERALADMSDDLMPYRHLSFDAIMPAHVIYPQVDFRPAGFSPVWINKLRNEFAFDGVIFSDDLSMEGASVAGNIVDRANAAWTAGCDVLLVCNAPDDVGVLLETWQPEHAPCARRPLSRLVPGEPWQKNNHYYAMGVATIDQLTGTISP
ncbi:beta-N-acetylhexosaminidase [Rugosibacter aromaticivorans]|uniref:beta-N-acetylhexosaminidase n=1 Tax=Rugosibacter aromaticivorans TaxID=1565605 RepID=UPI000A85AC94|nr:beta-N-acetylhexosaminidase [Rugosibacter aromaticivorans]